MYSILRFYHRRFDGDNYYIEKDVFLPQHPSWAVLRKLDEYMKKKVGIICVESEII